MRPEHPCDVPGIISMLAYCDVLGIISLLGSRMSMHSRMEPSFFGGVTMGDTHGVGSPTGTFSMVSSRRSLCSSSSIFGLIRKGIFLLVFATGLTDSLMCNLICTFFNLPIPFVRPGCVFSQLELILLTMFTIYLIPELQ